MRINTNVASLKTQNFLRGFNDNMQTVMERLSSGKRINSAKDDAAGTGIAARMEKQIRGMDVAVRNAQDGISLVETVESTLASVGNILQRIRELGVQADNGTYSASDKKSLNEEAQELINEINHISNSATFNGINLLSTAATIQLHISDIYNDTMTITLIAVDSTQLGLTALDLESAPQDAISMIDSAIDKVTSTRALLGATMNRLEFTIDNLATMSNNLSAARSRIEDADMAREVSNLTKFQILTQSTMSMLVQANQQPQSVLQLLQ